VKIREYSAPLTVLAAGVLGFSLICIVSAAALANPGTSESDFGAQDVVNSAFSNPISTAAALTAVEISEYISTPTPTFTASVTPSLTEISYITPTRPFVTWTPIPPTRTRMGAGRITATTIPSQVPSQPPPSRTPTKIPAPSSTNTRVPTQTFTPQPPPTDTPIPPTDTQAPTNTSAPSDTPEQPTDTPVVIDTSTPEGTNPP
jgi:hypothetical protein